MKPTVTRTLFFDALSDAEKNVEQYVKNPGKDMTRHRDCTFQDTVLATASLSMGRTNTELLEFFSYSKKGRIPSKSAYTQQRQKFNDRLFPHLLDAFNHAAPLKNTCKGFHLIAVDGTDLNLPADKNDTEYRVKQARSENYYYQMHVNALYDICENRFVSLLTQPRPKMNEKTAFLDLVAKCNLPENTIFIADRGYVSINTIATLIKLNRFFLIRAKCPKSDMLKGLVAPEIESDSIVKVGVTRSRKNKTRKKFDKMFFLRRDRTFDFIPNDDNSTVYEMEFRCLCIKLNDDSFEYLITNLPKDTFTPENIKYLYWKRWRIENSFRSLKYALSLSYLHSVNRELIIQEVYAKVILYNITSMLHAYVQKSKELSDKNKRTRRQYQVSFNDAVPVAKILLKQSIKNGIIKALLLTHLTSVSERGLTKPRKMQSQRVNPLGNRA